MARNRSVASKQLLVAKKWWTSHFLTSETIPTVGWVFALPFGNMAGWEIPSKWMYTGVKVPGAENTFERDRLDGADPRKKFGPNLSKKSKSDKLE